MQLLAWLKRHIWRLRRWWFGSNMIAGEFYGYWFEESDEDE
jgi:hypothetical protein